MPGPLFHVGAVAMCPHGGQVQNATPNARVLASGMPVVTMAGQSLVAGCLFTLPNGKPQPCVRVQWTTPAVRTLVNGAPPILQTTTGICLSAEQIPQGPPIIATTQPRAVAT
ncbi:MAG TPA: hypothetical protein VGB83_06495 [Actinomycetota bacterium]